MNTETVKMSTKGQIVIPQGIREEMKADEGTVFSIVSMEDTIILKKMKKPSKEELLRKLDDISKRMQKKLEARGFTEEDFKKID